jgi:hypothetical protein
MPKKKIYYENDKKKFTMEMTKKKITQYENDKKKFTMKMTKKNLL